MMRSTAVLLIAAALAVAVPVRAQGAPGTRYPSDEALRHYLAGRWLEETGDLAGAGAEFARALALDPDDESVLLRAAEVASKAGDPQRALELAHRARTRYPATARAAWLEGAALFNLGRAEEALVALDAARAADPGDAEILRTVARVAETLDRVELVDSCYSRVVELDEEDGEAWFQLATTRARLGRLAEADSALTTAIDLNPMRPGSLFLRGWIRERLGHPEEAAELFAHHLEGHPDDTATRRRLVALLGDLGRYPEAVAQAHKVTAANPEDASAWLVEADLEFLAGRPAAGEKLVARMVERAGDRHDAIGRGATVLARRGRPEKAIRLVDDWVRPQPESLRNLALRAWVRSIAGRPDSAVAWARLAAARYPDSLVAHRMLARHLRDARRWPDAVSELENVRARAPEDPSVLLDLGFCREQLGDVPGAIQAGRDALALAPDAPSALNFLGYVLADHERDLGEAEQLISRALQADPDNGAYMDSMGWLHFRRGDYSRAREELERALALTGGDPVIHEHLGDVYSRLNLPDLARQQYRLSLAGDSGNRRVQGKLEAAH